MRLKTHKTNRKTKKMRELQSHIECALVLLEMFKSATGYSNEEFLEYMNKYDIWSELNNKDDMELFIYEPTVEDVVHLFGKGLTANEKDNIISRNPKYI